MAVEHKNESAPNNADDWNNCSPGEVGHMVNRLSAAHRNHQIFQTASAAVIVLMVLGSGYFIKQAVIPLESGQIVAEILCNEVRQLGEKFVSDELDEDKSAQVEAHLADCESCRKFIENMTAGSQQQPPDAGAAHDVDKNFEQTVASRQRLLVPILIATGS